MTLLGCAMWWSSGSTSSVPALPSVGAMHADGAIFVHMAHTRRSERAQAFGVTQAVHFGPTWRYGEVWSMTNGPSRRTNWIGGWPTWNSANTRSRATKPR